MSRLKGKCTMCARKDVRLTGHLGDNGFCHCCWDDLMILIHDWHEDDLRKVLDKRVKYLYPKDMHDQVSQDRTFRFRSTHIPF